MLLSRIWGVRFQLRWWKGRRRKRFDFAYNSICLTPMSMRRNRVHSSLRWSYIFSSILFICKIRFLFLFLSYTLSLSKKNAELKLRCNTRTSHVRLSRRQIVQNWICTPCRSNLNTMYQMWGIFTFFFFLFSLPVR